MESKVGSPAMRSRLLQRWHVIQTSYVILAKISVLGVQVILGVESNIFCQ